MNRGGRIHCPNGLPVACIRFDGLMTECEHGDHPDYKFPVTVLGPNLDAAFPEYPQTVALIYADDAIAVTMYECGYNMWALSDGAPMGGSIQDKTARLSPASCEKVLEYVRSLNKVRL